MKEIKLQIPQGKDFMRWYEILYWKLTGGFTCNGCGAKTPFDHVEFESEVHGKRLIFSNNTAGLCAECTRDELNEKEDIVFDEENCECDWCNEHKNTMQFPRHEDMVSHIHFGRVSWNGSHICQKCMNIGVDNRGPDHSSILKHVDGKRYSQNELGLWVEWK